QTCALPICELDAGEREVDGLGERLDQQRLGEAGDADEQDVPAREQRHHEPLDDGLLPDDHPADLAAEAGVGVAEPVYGGGVGGGGGGHGEGKGVGERGNGRGGEGEGGSVG